MGSFARLWALVAACGLTPALVSCAINPQPEPPAEGQFTGGGGSQGGVDAGMPLDAGPSGMGGGGAADGGNATGGSGGTSSGGDAGGAGGSGGTGGTSNGVTPGAFDQGYAEGDDLAARLDAVNATDAGADDAGDATAADDGATQD